MNISSLQFLAQSNDWRAIYPEMMIGCMALVLLVLDILLPKDSRAHLPTLALAGLVTVLAGLAMNFHSGYLTEYSRSTFNGLLIHTPGGQLMRVFLVISAILTCLFARPSLAKQIVPHVEFYHIILVVTAALMLLVQSDHFVMLFVALETVTVGFYVLVAYYRSNALTLEGGLKYLVMGSLSSAMLLFGIVLLYGIAGNPELAGSTPHALQFEELHFFLAANPHNFIAAAGIALVLAGVAFKVGAFPFQIWVPDVYQGAPTPVTAFLAVASKGAGFSVLLVLTTHVFSPYAWLITPVLTLMAAATLLFGNLAALRQPNVKRLIGLSGVSHAGFLLVGVVAAATIPTAVGAVYFYLFSYLFASFAVLGVMTLMAGEIDTNQTLDDYAGLFRRTPFLAWILAIGLGSLAGIPPLVGFIGKLLIFVAAYQARLFGLLAVAVFGVVISIYYYFGWIRKAFFEERLSEEGTASTIVIGMPERLILAALALATIGLGFYQGPIVAWFQSL